MKTLLATAAAAMLLTTGAVSAATATGTLEQPGAYGPVPAASPVRPTTARAAQPRVSYGVGYHGRTSATGGPVGGYPSRN